MTLLYTALFIATLAMFAVLALMFFARRLRSLLKAHLYHRAFAFFAILAVTGILLAGILGLTLHNHIETPALAAIAVGSK